MEDQLGALLRRLRKRSGLTQEQLAERSGVSVRTIRRLETGGSADHRTRTVLLLADALGVEGEERRELAAVLAKAPPEQAATPAPVPEPVPASVPEPAPLPVRPAALVEAAAELASEVGRRWRAEEEQRRVHDPFPLPVRWRVAPAELTDRRENVQRLPPGSAPGVLDLGGDLRGVAEVYRRIPSGRLVVLGRGGSGKSVLAARFLLDLLAQASPADRVPVIFSVGSWDPTRTGLRDWLAERLLRDHPHLVARAPGGTTLAAALVDAGLVLPVLDGFDEIAEGLRPDALDALNASSLPLVLTSRRQEYAEAVQAAGVPLVWAAAVELIDLTPGDLADYLPRTARPVAGGGDAGLWDGVLAALRTRDGAAERNLAAVLSTPLMVVLARTVYSETPGADPAELLDAARFPTRRALEEHLLAGFVPTLYRRHAPGSAAAARGRWAGGDVAQVRYWLGYLAHHLAALDDGSQRDLAWWRIGESVRRSTRLVVVALACGLAATAADWAVSLVLRPLLLGWTGAGVGAALLDGVLVGPVAALGFGLMYGVVARPGAAALAPTRVRLRLPWPRVRVRVGRRPVRVFASRFGAGLLGGLVVGAGYAAVLTLHAVLATGLSFGSAPVLQSAGINMLAFGLIFGLPAATVFTLVAVCEAPLDIACAATPSALLAANRSTAARQVVVFAPLLALATALGGVLVTSLLRRVFGPVNWSFADGLLSGAVVGLGGALAYALAFTAWGQWVLLSRIWLPLTGRLPRDTAAFLDDAYRRGVLRRSGAVHQFRHSRLQHHLGAEFRAQHTSWAPAVFDPLPSGETAVPGDAAAGRSGAAAS